MVVFPFPSDEIFDKESKPRYGMMKIRLGGGLGAALKAAYLAGESPAQGIAHLPGK